MRRKLQNPVTAVILTALAILLAVLLGGRASLTRMRAEAWALYAGSEDGEYGSISYDLREISANAANLKTVADRYMQTEDPLLEEIRSATAAVAREEFPARKFQYAEGLKALTEELNGVLANSSISVEDERYRNELMANIESSYKIIGHSEYNTLATDFNNTLDQMPAALIAKLWGIEKLELYA